MKTISEKIMVMQAFEKGLKIEQVSISDGNCFWESNESHSFDWEKYDYRIKEEPSLVPFDGSDAFSLLMRKFRRKDALDQDFGVSTRVNVDGVYIDGTKINYGKLSEWYEIWNETLQIWQPCNKVA